MNASDPHKQMAAAVGRVPSGIYVLTIQHEQYETGMLASFVQQCSFQPLQVSVAIKREREISRWLTEGAAFTLNVLEAGQTDMVVQFGKGFSLDQPAFAGIEVERPEGGAPVLTEALAYLQCRVVSRFPAGDHDLLVAKVVGGKVLDEGQPMVHVRKSGLHY